MGRSKKNWDHLVDFYGNYGIDIINGIYPGSGNTPGVKGNKGQGGIKGQKGEIGDGEKGGKGEKAKEDSVKRVTKARKEMRAKLPSS